MPPRRRAPLAPDPETSRGLDLTAEYLSSILVLTGLGWLLQVALPIAPFGLIVGVLAGNAMGLYLLAMRTREGATTTDGATDDEDPVRA